MLKKIGDRWYRLDGPVGVYASIRAVGRGQWGVAVRRDDNLLSDPEVYVFSRASAIAYARSKFQGWK